MESHSLCDDGVVLNDDLSNLLLGGILTRWLIEESMLRVLLASYMVDVLASDGVEGDFLIKPSWCHDEGGGSNLQMGPYRKRGAKLLRNFPFLNVSRPVPAIFRY